MSHYWIRQAISQTREGGDREGAAKAEAEIVTISDQKDAQINQLKTGTCAMTCGHTYEERLEASTGCEACHRAKYLKSKADNERLRGLLLRAKRPHYYCEDSWYSCPKAPDGCADENQGDECNCGADAWNAEIEAALGVNSGESFALTEQVRRD